MAQWVNRGQTFHTNCTEEQSPEYGVKMGWPGFTIRMDPNAA